MNPKTTKRNRNKLKWIPHSVSYTTMNMIEWFRQHIGKKVVAKSEDKKAIGVVQVKNYGHALHLHKLQSSGYRYETHHDEDNDSITPLVTGIFIGEMLSGSVDDSNISSITTGDSDFSGFGGGSSDGGGASDSGFSYDSSSDSSSDSGSSDY